MKVCDVVRMRIKKRKKHANGDRTKRKEIKTMNNGYSFQVLHCSEPGNCVKLTRISLTNAK